VRVLLDTQAWLWMNAAPDRLSRETRELLNDPDNDLFLSAASCWEIAVKEAIGKLRLPETAEQFVPSRASATGTRFLPVNHRHALRGGGLPLHHRDPFDRLLIAQSQVEEIPILTSDRIFGRYDVDVISA
jgi:PIN domain nuclease of toxin-antitoxin system